MSRRESLAKLKVDAVRALASEHGISVTKKNKDSLINEILLQEAPLEALIPCSGDGNSENLPPFNTVEFVADGDPGTLSFSELYSFMLLKKSRENNHKAMDKAVRHFDAGDVQEIQFSRVNESTYYVRATCQASMKKIKYMVYVCISARPSGPAVQSAYCQCPVGMAQACSHIGGLLFAMSKARTQPDDVAPTSRLCQWNVPRQSQKPQPLSSYSNRKPKLIAAEQNTPSMPVTGLHSFDPRHTADQTTDMEHTVHQLQALKEIFPGTGMAHLWHIPEQVPDVAMEVEVTTTEDPVVSQINAMIISKGKVPPVTIDIELVKAIEEHTREQRYSSLWSALHIGRLTSSMFGNALKAGKRPTSLVKQIVEGSSLNKYDKLPKAVQWGIDNEARAREDYCMLQAACSENFNLTVTGLTLSASHSFLGASSDGRVSDSGDEGVLEIKCPFSVKGTEVTQMEVADIVDMNSNSFCLEIHEGETRLKRNHIYYAQVQGEMSIMGLPWCDFVVWTDAKENNIFIERVSFDIDYVQHMLPKLVEFYVTHVLPSLSED